MSDEALDLLEQLLSLTEPVVENTDVWRRWQTISAHAADLRGAKKCKAVHADGRMTCKLVTGHEDAHEDVYRWIDPTDFLR